MPKVQNLKLGFNANRMERYSLVAAGFEHLTGLNKLSTKIGGAGTNECNRRSAESVFADAIGKHPSTPIINVQWVDWNYCGNYDKYNEAPKEIWKQLGVQEKNLEGDAKKLPYIRCC